MPERIEKLRATLGELERELNSLETVDPETRDLLEETMEEIELALHKQELVSEEVPGQELHSQEAGRIEPETLAERLKLAVQDFEGEHPTLAAVVNRTIHALGQLGI